MMASCGLISSGSGTVRVSMLLFPIQQTAFMVLSCG
jgi:hypothetical protein